MYFFSARYTHLIIHAQHLQNLLKFFCPENIASFSPKICLLQVIRIIATSRSFPTSGIYILVYSIENRSRLIAVNNIRKNKTELVIFLFSIFISFFMQEMDKDVIHIYVTIALFCLSFVMISISLVIFFKFRQVHRNLIIMLTLRSA